MRRLVEWAIKNSPAMNILMIAVLAVGMYSLYTMRREVFPEFELEVVLVTVPYPGASPEEVEEGICQKIEESVQSTDGIKKITSVAQEGLGSVILELRSNISDVQKVVNEVRSEVDRIPSFPVLAEDAEIQQITIREPAINIAIKAPANREFDELELRAVAETVRDDLLELDKVSQVTIKGARDYQIDIEIDEQTLQKHGLSLEQVARIVRRENLEVPGGKLLGEGQEVLLRGENKRLIGQQISELPLITEPGGAVLTVGDLGTVRDDFNDLVSIVEVDGDPALVLEVSRTRSEDLLAMTDEVNTFVKKQTLPAGYKMLAFADRSQDVKDRLALLQENGLMGLLLVFLVLAVFLELRLAFWVALGIPVALLGAGGVLLLGGQTLNMLSMFSFLMALGIVVDDAIVVGENIYSQRQGGKSFFQAAVDGTTEVLPSVSASVATTVIAFCPMMFVSGVMGKFFAVIPFAVIAMLLLSLLECVFILPCHLAHDDSLIFRVVSFLFAPLRFIVVFFRGVNRISSRCLERLITGYYRPTLQWALVNRYVTLAMALSGLLFTVGFVRAGFVPFVIFPKVDSNYIQGSIAFPDGTPSEITDEATQQLVDSLEAASAELTQDPNVSLVKVVYRMVGAKAGGGNVLEGGGASGGHVGSVDVELFDTSQRKFTAQELVAKWRELANGKVFGMESLTFGERAFGPAGTQIEFKLLVNGGDVKSLEKAVELCKEKLATYPGVFDVEDDSTPGKWEYRIRVKEEAQSLGVTTGDLADTVRASYYGAEVMRLQRGRHEVKLMVRYPKADRRSLADFDDILVRVGDGVERPLSELAEIDVVRGYSEINRVDQKRSITVSADVDESQGNAREIVRAMQAGFMPELLSEFPTVQVRWEGQQEQTQESLQSLLIATCVALLVMFVLLTLEFKAYFQPLLVLAIIPFGFIGAILGHFLLGLPLTMFSFFGLVALTGVVVNDSIVLIDFINRKVRSGIPIDQALLDAGQRRFRPVLLTSLTTIAGLSPILFETSFQAQILIPMATSLSFGLLVATLLVVILVPTFYRIYFDFQSLFGTNEHPATVPIQMENEMVARPS